MKPIALMVPFALSLALAPVAPVEAQQVSADIFIANGPISGRVSVGDRGYHYPADHVVVYRRTPRRVVVVERYAPRPIVVYRMKAPRGKAHGWYKRHGYQPVTVYYRDGRYYDRVYHDYGYRGETGFRAVVLWERGGRLYRPAVERRDRDRYRSDRDRWGDDDRYDWDD